MQQINDSHDQQIFKKQNNFFFRGTITLFFCICKKHASEENSAIVINTKILFNEFKKA